MDHRTVSGFFDLFQSLLWRVSQTGRSWVKMDDLKFELQTTLTGPKIKKWAVQKAKTVGHFQYQQNNTEVGALFLLDKDRRILYE